MQRKSASYTVCNMNETLRDFIVSRKTEIKRQLRALKQEWRELQAAESAISTHESTDENQRKGITIKEMILGVLAEPNTCANAQEIISMIKRKYDVEIQRTSISPQLSRLRQEGRLYMKGNNFWCLAEQSEAQNKEASGADTLDASEEVNPLS